MARQQVVVRVARGRYALLAAVAVAAAPLLLARPRNRTAKTPVPASPLAQQGSPAPKTAVHIKTAQELQGAIAQVDKLFAGEYGKDNLASVTVGVISGPNLVWTKSYGLADIENRIPATKDSTYRIGSITKEFTAIMLLQLVQQGKVHLSDPVEKYYPEIKRVPNSYPWAEPISLLQLATHTAGLAAEPAGTGIQHGSGTETYQVGPYLTGQVADWEKTLLAALPHTKYAYEPGTRYFYSNMGFAILGAALARAAGQPYIQYVQQHILAPLGMTHTAFEQNPEILRTLAKGYVIHDGVADPKPSAIDLRDGRGYKIPNGALFSTVGDLGRWVSFEMGEGPETVLKKSVLEDIHSRVYSANGDLSEGTGIAFRLARRGDVMVIGHGGSVNGYVAGAYFDPRSHVGLVFLRNAGGHGDLRDLTLVDREGVMDVVFAAFSALLK